MRKSASFVLPASILAGVVGFVLRRVELNTVFDPATGLAEKSAPVSAALIILSFAVAVFLVAYALVSSKKYAIENSAPALSLQNSVLLVLDVLVMLAMIAGSVYYFLESDVRSIAVTAFAVFAALTGIAFAAVPLAAKRGKNDMWMCILSVIPALFFCFWLVWEYRQNAGEPVLRDYCYSCLALCALALSAYFNAGFVFAKGKLAASVATGMFSVYIGLVALADIRTSALTFLLIVVCCAQIVNTAAIMLNTKEKAKA